MRIIFLFSLILMIGMGCASDTAKTNENATTAVPSTQDIELLTQEVYDETTNSFNKEKTLDLIAKSQVYAANAPKDSVSLNYLFKAASMARAIKEPNKALSIYDKIYTDYSDSPKAPQALFLKGFILENELAKSAEARKIYELFLEKHPDNDFAKDARFLLSNLGKSNEEIIKNFEAQQGKKK